MLPDALYHFSKKSIQVSNPAFWLVGGSAIQKCIDFYLELPKTEWKQLNLGALYYIFVHMINGITFICKYAILKPIFSCNQSQFNPLYLLLSLYHIQGHNYKRYALHWLQFIWFLLCMYNRYHSRFIDYLAHPNLSATLVTDQKWPLKVVSVSLTKV